jgi:putative transcriptional regulator
MKAEAGRRTVAMDVAGIREKLGLSQAQFATLLDISKHTLQSWEHGKRNPSGPAKTLLLIAQKHPEVVLEAQQ